MRHTNRVPPMAALARTQGFKTLFVPASDAPEAALVPDLDVYPIETLFALVMHLQGMQPIAPYRALDNFKPADAPTYATDFSEIRGQEHVKRALEVAVAGQHNVFMLCTTRHHIQRSNPRILTLNHTARRAAAMLAFRTPLAYLLAQGTLSKMSVTSTRA